jgi:hypothetical protein
MRSKSEESISGDVDSLCVAEVLDGRADGGLELDDGLSVVGDLVVDNDLHRELLLLHDPLDRLDVDPQVVGVEDLELLDRLEVLEVL